MRKVLFHNISTGKIYELHLIYTACNLTLKYWTGRVRSESFDDQDTKQVETETFSNLRGRRTLLRHSSFPSMSNAT